MISEKLTEKLGRRYTEIAGENSEEANEKEIKITSLTFQNQWGEELQREKNLNLGENKNNVKRKRKKKERRGEANKKGEEELPKQLFPFLFSLISTSAGLTLFDRACNYLSWTAH